MPIQDAARPDSARAPSPAATKARSLRAALLVAGGICASAWLFSFSFLSFLHVKEAALYGAMTSSALLLCLEPAAIRPALTFFFPLWLLIALASVVHLGAHPAQVASDAVIQTVRWALLLLAPAIWFDLLQESRWRRTLRSSIVISACGVGLMAVAQYFGLAPWAFPEFPGVTQRVYSVFGNQDLLGGYMALALPMCVFIMLRHRRLPALWMTCFTLMLGVLLLSGSRSAWLAAAVGLVTMTPYRRLRPRRAWLLLGAAMTTAALCISFAPATTIGRAWNSFAADDVGGRARLWFWDGSLRMIADHPLVGIGPGNYPYWSPWYLGKALDAIGGERHYHNQLLTEHPHSDPLNILAETGLVGAACALWMLWRVLRLRGPEYGGIAALLTFSLFNNVATSPPHAFAGLLFCGMLAARDPHWRETFQKFSLTRSAALSTTALCVGLSVFWAWAVLMPSYALRTAFNAHVETGKAPLDEYACIAAHPWPNASAHEHHGMALFDDENYEAADREFLLALRGLDTGRVHFLRGASLLKLERMEEARQEFEKTVWRWPSFEGGWKGVWRTSPPENRAALSARAARWGFQIGVGETGGTGNPKNRR
ncbi:MAG TPA: O-antigen ligase family protein [Candidatus Hydrogenedentes bacterium]|nr:O-antigen ligase family protein [Candidatus Hydrogenedentota bacterium]